MGEGGADHEVALSHLIGEVVVCVLDALCLLLQGGELAGAEVSGALRLADGLGEEACVVVADLVAVDCPAVCLL